MKKILQKVFTVMFAFCMLLGNAGNFASMLTVNAEDGNTYSIDGKLDAFTLVVMDNNRFKGGQTFVYDGNAIDVGEVERDAHLAGIIQFNPSEVKNPIEKGDALTCSVPSILSNGSIKTWDGTFNDETTEYGKINGRVGSYHIENGIMTIYLDDGYIEETEGVIRKCMIAFEGVINSYGWPEHVDDKTLYYGDIPVNLSFADINLKRDMTLEKTVVYNSTNSNYKNYAATDGEGYLTYSIRMTAAADNSVPLENVILGDVFTSSNAKVADVKLLSVSTRNISGIDFDITDQAVRITDPAELNGKDFAWNVGTVNRGETVEVTFKVKLDEDVLGTVIAEKRAQGFKDTNVSNRASAEADKANPVYADFTVPVMNEFSMSKQAVGPRDAQTGRKAFAITITVPESNPYIYKDMVVADRISAGSLEAAKVISDGGITSVTVKHADGTEETLGYNMVEPFTQEYTTKNSVTYYDYWMAMLDEVRPGDVVTVNTYLTVTEEDILAHGAGTRYSFTSTANNYGMINTLNTLYEYQKTAMAYVGLERNWLSKSGSTQAEDMINWSISGNQKDPDYLDLDISGQLVKDRVENDQTISDDTITITFTSWATNRKVNYTGPGSDGLGNLVVPVNADKKGFEFTIPDGFGQCSFKCNYRTNAPAAYGQDINYSNTVTLGIWETTASTVRKKVAALDKMWTAFGKTNNDDGSYTTWMEWKTDLFGAIGENTLYTDTIDASNLTKGLMELSEEDIAGIQVLFNGNELPAEYYTLTATADGLKYSGFTIQFHKEVVLDNNGVKEIPSKTNPVSITYRTTVHDEVLYGSESMKAMNIGKVSDLQANWTDSDSDWMYRTNRQDISKLSTGMKNGKFTWKVRVNSSGTDAHPEPDENGNIRDENRENRTDYVLEFKEIIPAGLEFDSATVIGKGSDFKSIQPEIAEIRYEKNPDGTPKRNDDGTQTVYIKLKNCVIYTNNKNYKSTNSFIQYHAYSYIDVEVATKIVDEKALYDNSENYHSYKNIVEVDQPNGITKTASAIQSLRHTGIKKSMVYNAATAPNARFTLEVNGGTDGPLDLNPYGDTIALIDESNNTLQIDPNTIHVLNLDTNREEAFTLDVQDMAKGLFKINIPDNMHLKVTYEAEVSGVVGESVLISNKAYFEGQEDNEDVAHFETYTTVLESSASSESNVMVWLKKVNGKNERLGGAKFRLEAYKNGQWTETETGIETGTTGFGTKVQNLEKNVLYRLVETSSPEHYVLSETPKYFCIQVDKNSVVEKPADLTADIFYCRVASTLYAYNVPYAEVAFEKYADDGTTLLPGASLQVEDADGNIIRDENGNEVMFMSGDDTKKYWIAPGRYTLRETASPTGYSIAAPVSFTVNADETVTCNGQNPAGNLVSLTNEKTTVSIRKITENGTVLPGAVLQIIDPSKSGADAVIEEWTTTADDAEITGLSVNTTYILHEQTAPAGYLLAEDTSFRLNSDGTLDTAVSQVTVGTDGVILVTDKKPELVISKVERLFDAAVDSRSAGAVIALYDGTNKVAEWTSTADTNGTFGTIEAGKEYIVREESVPAGYTKFADFTVQVNPDGRTVLSAGASAEFVNGVLVMKNTYEPAEAEVTLRVSKIVRGTTPDPKDFIFTLKQNGTDAKDPVTVTSVSGNTAGVADFETLKFDRPGTYSYVIHEERTNPSKTSDYYNSYSFAEDQTVTITVTDDHANGKLVTTVTANGQAAVIEHGKVNLTFVNTYKAGPTNIAIPVAKQFSTDSADRPVDKEFTFEITGTNGTPTPAGTSVSINGSGSTVFPAITYDAAGEYTYDIREIVPTDLTDYTGYTFSQDVYHVTVTVRDNNGALQADTVITKNDEAGNVPVVFTNSYSPVAAELNAEFTKTLKDLAGNVLDSLPGTRADDLFAIKVTAMNGSPLPQNPNNAGVQGEYIGKVSKKNPSFMLPAIEISRAGTYSYAVQELASAEGLDENGTPADVSAYYTFDTTVKVVTFEVVDNNGMLQIRKNANGKDYTVTDVRGTILGDEMQNLGFTNTYAPKPVNAVFNVRKEIAGESPATSSDFTFTLTEENGAPLPTEKTVTISGEGNKTFAPIKYDKAGVYTYKIKENKPAASSAYDPYAYDETERIVTVTVTDESGTLHAAVSVSGNTAPLGDQEAVFTNTYAPNPVTVKIPVTKQISGHARHATKDFEFEIATQNNAPLPEDTIVTINDEGTAEFPEIKFTSAGVYHYEIAEIDTGEKGYDYDDTLIQVTVTVTDENGILKAVTAVENNGLDSVKFVNTYSPMAAYTSIVAAKLFTETSKARPDKKDFTFYLEGKNNAPMAQDDEIIVADGEEGTFGMVTFAQAGTYTYVVSEKRDAYNSYTFDQDHTIEYTVEDQNGYLVITDIKVDGESDEKLTFRNSYIPEEATFAIPVSKKVDGKPKKAETFEFELEAEGNEPLPQKTTVKVKAGKTASFEAIHFDEAGTYTYIVSEKDLGQDGYTYDTSRHTVTVTVTDEDGVLKAEWELDGRQTSEDDAVVFTNKYEEKKVATVETGVETNAGIYAIICSVSLLVVALILWTKRNK